MYKLRPYQSSIKESVYDGWGMNAGACRFRRQMVQLPTGGGKTILFNSIVNDFVERGEVALIVAHRRELIHQAATKFERLTGMQADIVMGSTKRLNTDSLVKVGSIQTLSARIKRNREGEYQGDTLGFQSPPRLIVIDEAHHVTARTYRNLLDYYPEAKVLQVTATPCRTNGGGFSDVADRLVVGVSVQDLERMWEAAPKRDTGLTPDVIRNIRVTRSMSKVKKVRGEYDTKEVSEMLNSDGVCEQIVKAWLEFGEDAQTIAFCSKKSKGDAEGMNERLARLFNEAGVPAACITGETKADVRGQLISDFERGKIRVLTNVEIFTEGFDVPNVGCVILARPTLSLSLYLQMVGRGKRPAGQSKKYNIVLDFVENVANHGFPNQEREWTLDGIKTKPKELYVKIKGQDEIFPFEFLPEAKPGESFDYELVEMDEPYRTRFIDSFISAAIARHGRDSSRYKTDTLRKFFKHSNGEPTYRELQYIGSKLNYKPIWANAQHGSFKQFNRKLKEADSPKEFAETLGVLKKRFMFTTPDGVARETPAYKILHKRLMNKYNQFKNKQA